MSPSEISSIFYSVFYFQEDSEPYKYFSNKVVDLQSHVVASADSTGATAGAINFTLTVSVYSDDEGATYTFGLIPSGKFQKNLSTTWNPSSSEVASVVIYDLGSLVS